MAKMLTLLLCLVMSGIGSSFFQINSYEKLNKRRKTNVTAIKN